MASILSDWIAVKLICGKACTDPTVTPSYTQFDAKLNASNVYRLHRKTDVDATNDLFLFTDGKGGVSKVGADQKVVPVDVKAQASDLLATYATVVSFDVAVQAIPG